MTNTTDKQLKKWLDSYKVDTSPQRLSRLEDRIMSQVAFVSPPLFTPLGWQDKVITAVSVCTVLIGIFACRHFLQTGDDVILLSAYSYSFGGY